MIKIMPLLIVTLLASGDGSKFTRFNNAIMEHRFDEAEKIIKNWGKNKTADPQFHICLFNLHMNKARSSGISVNSQGVNPSVTYDKKEAHRGIAILKKAIKKFPRHFEMRYGLIWAYFELKEFNNALSEVKSSFKYLSKHKNETIYWNNNEVLKSPESFIFPIAQGYFRTLVQEKRFLLHSNMPIKFADIMIKYFPKNKIGYTNKGSVLLIRNKTKRALKYLKMAHNLDKDDLIIIMNLGMVYKDLNNKAMAKKYFTKIVNSGEKSQIVEAAKRELGKL